MTSTFPAPYAQRVSIGLAIVRIVTGLIFAMHGYQKLFVFGFAGVSGGFAQMGIPLPGIVGPMVGLLEFFGGIALIVGLLTRLTGLGLAIDMLGAIFIVHLKNGFFLPQGYEFVLLLFATSAALALTGAGEYSADSMIASRRTGSSRTTL